MNISTLQTKILALFKQQEIDCSVCSLGTIEVNDNGEQRKIHLYNLLREMQLYPQQEESLAELFVQRCFQSRAGGDVFPRLISFAYEKPLYHPWVENLVPNMVDVTIVRHSKGVLKFLSPMDIAQSSQSLQTIKSSAVDNLVPLLEMVSIEERGKDVWRIVHPEILTSSLLLVLSCGSEELSQLLGNMEFAATPNRGSLWIGGSGLKKMGSIIHAAWERQPYPINPEIFEWTMGQSERWVQSWSEQRS